MADFFMLEKTTYAKNDKVVQALKSKATSLSDIVIVSGQALKSEQSLALSQNRVYFFDITKKSKRYGGSFLLKVGNEYHMVSDSKLRLSSDVIGKLIHSELASIDLIDSKASAA